MSRKSSKTAGIMFDSFDFSELDPDQRLGLSMQVLGGAVLAIANECVELPPLEGVFGLTKIVGFADEGAPNTIYAAPGPDGEDKALKVLVEILRSDQEIPRDLRDFLANQLDPMGTTDRRLIFAFRETGKGKRKLRTTDKDNLAVAQYVYSLGESVGTTKAEQIVADYFNVDPSRISQMRREAQKRRRTTKGE